MIKQLLLSDTKDDLCDYNLVFHPILFLNKTFVHKDFFLLFLVPSGLPLEPEITVRSICVLCPS